MEVEKELNTEPVRHLIRIHMEMVWLLSVMDQPLLPDLVTHNAAEVSKINSFCTFINSVSLIGKHE